MPQETNTSGVKIYLKEPRLTMNIISRLAARLIIYSVYTVLFALTVTFIFSDIKWLPWVGALIALFLGDRLLHAGGAEKSLLKLNSNKAQDINLADYFTPQGVELLEKATDRTLISNSNFYLQLAKLLIKEKDVRGALLKTDVSPDEFEQKIDDFISKKQRSATETPAVKITRVDCLKQIETLGQAALLLALKTQEKYLEPRILFSALIYSGDQDLNRLFKLFSITAGDMESVMVFAKFHSAFGWLQKLPATLGGFTKSSRHIRHRIMNRAWSARPTPTLDRYSTDLTDLARSERVGFLIGHEKEYSRLVDVLARPTKPNAILVGEPGSGKETIVSHLAFQIIQDKAPAALFDKRLVALQVGNMVAGISSDEVSGRVNKILNEIMLAGNIILFIPDIHNLLKTSGPNYLNAADILIPAIVGDAFPVVGATYPKEWKEMAQAQTDFVSAFEEIRVEEISEADAIKLLTYGGIILESQYKIIISFGAVKKAVLLAHKYFHEKLLPSSAEDLLKEAVNYGMSRGEKTIRPEDLIAVAERKSSIPIHQAAGEEAEKLLNLEEIIHRRLIDQNEAVSAVSKALREYRSGLSRKGGPIAVFLFVGPTGVGKTELAKILADIQFGSEKMMVRLDMSEYQDKSSVARFIGSSDGRLAGNLTESIIQKPYSLVLLDEFEKAHPDILNLFLQVFDDGRLTDGLGRTIDFTNTIIIATSNAHSDFIKNHIEAHTPIETIAEELKKKLTDYFHPELLNRFSDIVVFKTLSLSDIEAITKLQLQNLSADVNEASGIDLSFEPAVVKKIAELGFDPVFGGRPLRGVIAEKIRSVLAEKILKGEVLKGSTIIVSLNRDDAFAFREARS